MSGVVIRRVESFLYRAPVATPVVTSFGVMTERPAVLVRVEDSDGAAGWGEVWCNFPGCGAEHRARLIDTVIAPLVIGRRFAGPEAASLALAADTRILILQTGERGPFAQVLAGIDIAFWDLISRQAGKPLCAALGGGAVAAVPAYASGIHPTGAHETMARCRAEGHTRFKLKIGFDQARDIEAVKAADAELGADERLMLDANQAWDLATALAMVAALAPTAPGWLEEPLAADAPLDDWRTLAGAADFPLAAGENLIGRGEFDRAIASGALGVIQPDACKWGGLSGARAVAKAAMAAGLSFSPHFLGAGIGLLASAHLLAALGGDGLVEIDVNPNPLRQSLAQPFPDIAGGSLALPDGAGLGVEPDLEDTRKWLVHHGESF